MIGNETVPWYITFGFGGPYAGQYSEIRVPARLPVEEQNELARQTAFATYGTAWAFDYRPDQFERCIGRFGMKLREIIVPEGVEF